MDNKPKNNIKAIGSLVCSCAAVINCCMWYIAVLCAIVGIVLGILALRDENPKQKDLAIAGIVVGVVGLAIGITMAVMYIMMYSAASNVQDSVPVPTTKPSLPDFDKSADTKMMIISRILRR